MLAATFSTVIVFRALVPVSSPPPWSFILTAVAQPSSALFSLAFPCFLVNCVNFSLCLPLPSLAHSQFSFLISRSYPLSFATFLPIFLSLPFDSSTFFPLSLQPSFLSLPSLLQTLSDYYYFLPLPLSLFLSVRFLFSSLVESLFCASFSVSPVEASFSRMEARQASSRSVYTRQV